MKNRLLFTCSLLLCFLFGFEQAFAQLKKDQVDHINAVLSGAEQNLSISLVQPFLPDIVFELQVLLEKVSKDPKNKSQVGVPEQIELVGKYAAALAKTSSKNLIKTVLELQGDQNADAAHLFIRSMTEKGEHTALIFDQLKKQVFSFTDIYSAENAMRIGLASYARGPFSSDVGDFVVEYIATNKEYFPSTPQNQIALAAISLKDLDQDKISDLERIFSEQNTEESLKANFFSALPELAKDNVNFFALQIYFLRRMNPNNPYVFRLLDSIKHSTFLENSLQQEIYLSDRLDKLYELANQKAEVLTAILEKSNNQQNSLIALEQAYDLVVLFKVRNEALLKQLAAQRNHKNDALHKAATELDPSLSDAAGTANSSQACTDLRSHLRGDSAKHLDAWRQVKTRFFD